MWSTSEEETRLYHNGKLVGTGPGSSNNKPTKFVIGNAGETNYMDYFRGEIRSLRISSGLRYESSFEPAVSLEVDETTLLSIETPTRRDNLLCDGSGNLIGKIEEAPNEFQ